MNMVFPCSRQRFTDTDRAFIASVLTTVPSEREALLSLLAEPAIFNDLLDDPALLQRLLESPQTLTVSTECYFYILTRHWLLRHGIQARDTADYIASVLVAFTHSLTLPCSGSRKSPFPNVVDTLLLLDSLPARKGFETQAWLANLLLVLTGLFPQHIEDRHQRFAAPALPYYEATARSQFQSAGRCDLADRLGLRGVFESLGEIFGQVRLALNELSERALTF